MDLTPSTPQTSSSSSNDMALTAQDQELDAGSECGWRDTDPGARPIFYMGEEDQTKYSVSGLYKNLEGQKIRVGICAMAKKTHSKPMKEILARLTRFENLQVDIFDESVILNEPVEAWPVVDALISFFCTGFERHTCFTNISYLQVDIFDESVILNEPVEAWPVVDALISFFSTGFPLQKAIQYKNLHKPFVVNDLEAQYAIKDRREVYKILVREGIAHPRYAVMNRDCEEKGEFSENEDAIDVNGTQFQRPFVEKPVDAEDHNIYIYFPVSAGGGCQKLFRKVGSRSSVYSSCNRVRKIGSFIYEDFMPTDGTDVKVYTVGPDYAHAEARKSPALDGKVERDKDGKEVRYPVLLSAAEKMIARKVCLAFKQNVCGFDLLRTGGKSYVCDVNGFSFVKNSTKYYDDCANVLGTMIIRALAPQLHIPLILGAAPEDIPVVPTTSGSMMELRCVIAVIRHGDRTPKQKMKMEVKHKKFFDLFEKYNGYKKGHLKLKKPKQLQEVLDISRDLLTESHHETNPEVQEKKAKLRQLKLVLEMYGHFSGINRKVQLKYQPNGAPKKSSSEEGVNNDRYENTNTNTPAFNEFPKEPSLVLIVKWGGELTPAGKFQAEDLGKAFRTLYPGGQGEFETPGLGFLRLHSTFRHDLKIYASDEGRVQMTAAAFTKGLLALEGELTPILVSMVKSANTNGLLDKEGETSKYQHVVKEKLMDILNHESDFNEEDIEALAPTGNVSLLNAMDYIKNPKYMCDQIYEMVCEITNRIKTLKLELKTRDLKLYHGESWELLIRRWSKLEKDFKLKCGKYDISKIPDIYDCIKYDLQHNQKTLQYPHAEELFLYSKALADIVIPQLEKDFKLKCGKYDISKIPDIYDCIKYDLQHNQKTLQYPHAEELFLYSKALADIVIPQEYGITVEEKMHISQSICTPLMRKIHSDLVQACQGSDDYMTRLNSKYSKGVASPERFVRTRLYFTSESHIHSLLNMLRYGGLCEEVKDEQWKKAMDFLSSTPELNYMTQINIMMFEDPSKDSSCPEKFHVELHFSPGAYTCCDKNVMNPVSSGYRTSFLVKQANKFREPGMKKGKEDSCQSSLKDKLKDGLITEEISEEASDVSATNSLVVGDNNKKGFVMTEAGIKDFFTRQTTDNDDNRGKDSQKHETGNQNDDTIVEDGNDAVTESLDTSKDGAGDVNVSPSCVTISVDDAHGTRTDEFRDPDHLFIVDDLHDVVECKHVSEDSSVSSAYLTAEETEDDKCVLEELDNLTSGAAGVNKQDNMAKPGMDKSEHGSTVTSLDKPGNTSIGKSDTKEIEPDNKCDKTGDVVTKPVIKLPTTLNVTSVLADGKQDGGVEKKKKVIDADKELELLLPKEGVIIPEQRSPDPDVPEWDWGDDKVMKEDKSLIADKHERPHSTGTVKSLPITISSVSDTYLTTGTELKKSYEETRSHSLEEGDSKDGGLALLEKHYRTIHLPINNDSHHSFSSLLYLNPDAFKAFDGFNMVPSLKPLETLHNNLTMQDLDEFLCRATTPKFFTPVSSNVTTPLPSPRCPELNRTKSSGPSLPSSSNSSAGPSSPTTASTPIDFLSRFKMYIIDSVRNEQYSLENDTDISSESSIGSVGLRQDSNQATVIPQRKFPPMSEPYSASPTPTDGLNMSSGHVSAFKAVSRSSSQKTQFVVTQVSEDSLRKDKSGKSESEEKKE